MMFKPRPKSVDNENFLKINPGELVVGLFKGDIYKFKQHWVKKDDQGASDRSVVCTGKETCEICKKSPDDYASSKFRVNFLVVRDETKVFPYLVTLNATNYDTLVNHDSRFDLSKTLVEATKRPNPKGKGYVWEFFPLRDRQIPADLQKALDKAKLLPTHGEGDADAGKQAQDKVN